MTTNVPPRLVSRKPLMLFLLALFLLPVAARAAVFAFSDHPRSFRDADWSSIGSLPPASEHPSARVLVLSGRTGGWKGVLAVHSWIVIKRENATRWTRFDVVGWGNPVRINGWAPDGRWFGSRPVVVADVQGKEAERLIPKIEAAVQEYRFANAGDYRVWPGPNSNTFTATMMRAVPELADRIAVQRYRPRLPHSVLTSARPTAAPASRSIFGDCWASRSAGSRAIEINFLGLVAGLDLRHPALKLPGYGRLGIDAILPVRAE